MRPAGLASAPPPVPPAAAAPPGIELRSVQFAYGAEGGPVVALESLRIGRGEQVFLRGPSGSGKSTLLGLIAGVLAPQAGSVQVLGTDLSSLGAAARDRFRADHIGLIFQLFNLIPYLSVVENVTLPCRFSPVRRERAARTDGRPEAAALRLLDAVGLGASGLLHRRVSDLSIGQQQRVAAARALIGAPEIVLADEPTSSLDADRRRDFVALLFGQCAAHGTTLVFASHDLSIADRFGRTLALGTGAVEAGAV